MAKSKRHGAKGGKKKHRKSAKRKAAGHKLVRFNKLRKQGYTKTEARYAVWGKKGGHKKGKKRGHKKGKKR